MSTRLHPFASRFFTDGSRLHKAVVLPLLGLGLALPGQAEAQANNNVRSAARLAPRIAVVELNENNPLGHPQKSTFTMHLGDCTRSAAIESSSRAGRRGYKVRATCLKAKVGPVMFDLDLYIHRGRTKNRKTRKKDDRQRVRVSARTRAVLGKRTVLGALTRPDGTRVEVAVTLR